MTRIELIEMDFNKLKEDKNACPTGHSGGDCCASFEQCPRKVFIYKL